MFVSEDVADEALGFAFSCEVDDECFDLVWLVDDPVGGSLGDGSCGAGSSSHVRHFADHCHHLLLIVSLIALLEVIRLFLNIALLGVVGGVGGGLVFGGLGMVSGAASKAGSLG